MAITTINESDLIKDSRTVINNNFTELQEELEDCVKLDGDQNITGTKTFVGTKKVAFKQSAANDKLGFTLYSNSNAELGYLEFNPTNKIDGAPVMTLGNYATAAAGITQVGFRRYSSISGANGAYNILTPLIADAKSPFSLTTTYTNFYIPLGITDGTTMVKTDKRGVLDISTLVPALPTASASTLGGIKVGNNLSIDSNGVLSATFGNYATKEEATSIARYQSFIAPKQDPLDVNDIDISNCTSLAKAFDGFPQTVILCSDWDTSNVTSMYYMFHGCSSLTSLDVSDWDTSNVTNMGHMFYGCSSLTSLDVSDWDTSNVTAMVNVFSSCGSLTSLDVSNWNTSNVTSMDYMFSNCSSLTSLDVSNWNTSNVTMMAYMFYGCSSLTSLDVSNFDISNVTSVGAMFNGCSSLTSLDVSNFDTSNVTAMGSMFASCTSLQYLIINSPTFKFQAKASISLPSTCKILVPSALIDTYKAATNWASHASKFDAIENYTITHSNGQVTVTPNA